MAIYFTRDMWGARDYQNRIPNIIAPSKRFGITIHHNGPALHVPTPAWSEFFLRAIQRYHMDTKGWSDIAYSWAFDNWGQVFACRGIVWDQFANGDDVVNEDEGGDASWYTALWLGGGTEVPTAAAYQAAESITKLVRIAGAGHKVRPHNQFQNKACPGPELTGWANHWNGRLFQSELPSSGRTVPVVEDEDEDMRVFVHTDSGFGHIFELVQTTPGGVTRKRHVEQAEWSAIQAVYGPRLIMNTSHAAVSALENA